MSCKFTPPHMCTMTLMNLPFSSKSVRSVWCGLLLVVEFSDLSIPYETPRHYLNYEACLRNGGSVVPRWRWVGLPILNNLEHQHIYCHTCKTSLVLQYTFTCTLTSTITYSTILDYTSILIHTAKYTIAH